MVDRINDIKIGENDKAIIQAIKEGRDDHSLSALYKNAFPKVKNLILKNNGTLEEAEDIFQDSVIVFYKYVQLGKFDEERDIDGFIYGVSRNLYAKHIIKVRNREGYELKDNAYPSGENLEESLITKEKETIIHELMNNLGERCKEMLTLSVFNKLSMKEISEKMGFANDNAAKTSNYKCKQRLMKMVKNNPSLCEMFKN